MTRSPPYKWSSDVLRRLGVTGRGIVIAIPWLWLLLFFLIPFVIVLKISFAETQLAVPPYTPLFQYVEQPLRAVPPQHGELPLPAERFAVLRGLPQLAQGRVDLHVFLLLIGYPMAYGIARATPAWRNILMLLVILPFWTSFLVRVYAWMGLLSNNGVINNVLMALRHRR